MNGGFFAGNELLAPNNFFAGVFSYESRAALAESLTPVDYAAVIFFEFLAGVLALIHWPLASAAALGFLTTMNVFSEYITGIMLDFVIIMSIVDRKVLPRALKFPLGNSALGLVGFASFFFISEISQLVGKPVAVVISLVITFNFLRQIKIRDLDPRKISGMTWRPAGAVASVFLALLVFSLIPHFLTVPKQIGFTMYDGRPAHSMWPLFAVRGRVACNFILEKATNKYPNSALYWTENSQSFPELSRVLEDFNCVWAAMPSPMTDWVLDQSRSRFPHSEILHIELTPQGYRSPASTGTNRPFENR